MHRQVLPIGSERLARQRRYFSNDPGGTGSAAEKELRAQVASGSVLGTKAEEAYALAFTCNVCGGRSAKKISKRAYHHGVVIVICPHCENKHLIADHLKWFGDEETDIVAIMREKGEEVVRLNQFSMPDLGQPSGSIVQVEGFEFPAASGDGSIACSGASKAVAEQATSVGSQSPPLVVVEESADEAAAAKSTSVIDKGGQGGMGK